MNISTDTDSCPKKSPVIPIRLNRLGESVKSLTELIGGLSNRLSSVTTPKKEGDIQGKACASSECEVAIYLETQIDGIDAACAKLQDILNRLEL